MRVSFTYTHTHSTVSLLQSYSTNVFTKVKLLKSVKNKRVIKLKNKTKTIQNHICPYMRLASFEERNIHSSPSLAPPSCLMTCCMALPTKPDPPVTNTLIGEARSPWLLIWYGEHENQKDKKNKHVDVLIFASVKEAVAHKELPSVIWQGLKHNAKSQQQFTSAHLME